MPEGRLLPLFAMRKRAGAVEADWAAVELVYLAHVLSAAFLVEPYQVGNQVQAVAAHGGHLGASVVEQAPRTAPLFGKLADV